MVVLPLTRALVPRLAGETRLGAHYGVLASVSGLAVLVGRTALGGVVQLASGPALPWLLAAALPAMSALAVVRVLRAVPRAGERSGPQRRVRPSPAVADQPLGACGRHRRTMAGGRHGWLRSGRPA